MYRDESWTLCCQSCCSGSFSAIQWLQYTFYSPGIILRCRIPAFSGPPMIHNGPGRSYCRRLQLLAVYAEVVTSQLKGHTLWHMYATNNAKTTIWLQENIVKWYDGFCTCLGTLEHAFWFNFTCLGAPHNSNKFKFRRPGTVDGRLGPFL